MKPYKRKFLPRRLTERTLVILFALAAVVALVASGHSDLAGKIIGVLVGI